MWFVMADKKGQSKAPDPPTSEVWEGYICVALSLQAEGSCPEFKPSNVILHQDLPSSTD